MHEKISNWRVVTLLVLLIVGVLVHYQVEAYGQGNRGNNVGDYAFEFTLTNLGGEEVSLSDYRGKKVVVNFWATWCPPCVEEMPDLDRFHARYDDLVVLGVNVGERESRVRDFIEEGGYQFPILLDQSREISRKYHVAVLPTTYFIDEGGQIVEVRRGMLTEAQLESIYQNEYDSFDEKVSGKIMEQVQIQRAFLNEQDNIIDNSGYCSIASSLMSKLNLEVGDKVSIGYGDIFALYTIVQSRSEDGGIVRMGLSGRRRLGQSDPFTAYLTKVEEVKVEKALFSMGLRDVANNSNYATIDGDLMDRLGLELGDQIIVRAKDNSEEFASYTIAEVLDEGEDIIRMGLNGRRRIEQSDPFKGYVSKLSD